MEGEANDVEFLLASVAEEITVLRQDRRLTAAGEGNRGEALRSHIMDLLGAAEAWVAQNPGPEGHPLAREVFSLGLRSMTLNLRNAHAAMPWLAATQSPQINLGGLYLAEELAEHLVGKDADLVAVPDWEYMYSTESWPFKEVIDETAGFTAKTERWPIVLHYPLGDGNRLLLHAILGHELSHQAVEKHGLAQSIAAEITLQPEYVEVMQAVIGQIWESNTPEKSERTLAIYLEAWLEELLCDHLAAALLGPSYLWSFAAFVMPMSYGDPSATHPPNTTRIRLLTEFLRELGWQHALSHSSPRIGDWLEEIAEDAPAHAGPQFDFLVDVVTAAAPRLREAATKLLAHNILKPSIETQADAVVGLLQDLILPVGDPPFEPRAILLGGWRHALSKHSGGPATLARALRDTQLQDLIGKAIEMSVVVSCWEAS